MTTTVKICGLRAPEHVDAAIAGGADLVGFVFYEPSPRYLTPAEARTLADRLPDGVKTVALVVDPDDALLEEIATVLRPDYVQFHGHETPDLIERFRSRFGIAVIKAIKLRDQDDVTEIGRYDTVADIVLFDAKAPDDDTAALPGGNGRAFDWTLLEGVTARCPTMLSGGLDADNVARAVAATGITLLDVSSGVESAPGVKDSAKIRRFLDAAKAL